MNISTNQRNMILAGLEIGDYISLDVLSLVLPPGQNTVDIARLKPITMVALPEDVPQTSIQTDIITLERIPQGWKRIA